MKDIFTAPFVEEMRKTTANMYRLGWDERNGGNISLLLDTEEVGEYLDLNAVKRTIEHIDLVMVTRDQKVQVDVPVTITGESAPGTITLVEMVSMTVTAPVIDIPEVIEVSVEGLEDGTVVRFEDLTLPDDVEADYEDDQPIVVVEIPRIDESDLETPAAEDEGAEGEDAGDAAAEEGSEDAEDDGGKHRL